MEKQNKLKGPITYEKYFLHKNDSSFVGLLSNCRCVHMCDIYVCF